MRTVTSIQYITIFFRGNCHLQLWSLFALERSLALSSLKKPGKSEPSSKLRKQLKKQQDSLDSVDSSISSYLSNTALSHGTRKRFQIYSKSPFYRAASAGEALGMEGPLSQTKSLEERPQFISRGTFNPEKGKQKLKNVKNSPQKTKETPEGTVMSGRRKPIDPDCSSTQQLALFGSNEFMVWTSRCVSFVVRVVNTSHLGASCLSIWLRLYMLNSWASYRSGKASLKSTGDGASCALAAVFELKFH